MSISHALVSLAKAKQSPVVNGQKQSPLRRAILIYVPNLRKDLLWRPEKEISRFSKTRSVVRA
jgi:hypothetical protein